MARSQETCLRLLFYEAAVFGSWMIGALRRQNHRQPVFRLLFCRTEKEERHMKKAILAVSFGTSYEDTLQKTIAAVEDTLRTEFPGWEVRRAFTSGMILKKLRARGINIDSVAQAMARLETEGYTHIAVQPTHIMHGEEYEKLLSALEPFRGRLQIAVGEPLLNSQADFEAVSDALLQWLPLWSVSKIS